MLQPYNDYMNSTFKKVRLISGDVQKSVSNTNEPFAFKYKS